jgi:hypothetical protein
MITTTGDHGSLLEVLEALTSAKEALPDAIEEVIEEVIDADAAPVNLNDSLAAVAAPVVDH